MKELQFFDCGVSFGRRKLRLPDSFYTKEGLIENMDALGIDRALVSHSVARELDPIAGNQMLMDEIAGNDRLLPLWTVLPHHTGEFPAPDVLVSQMKASNVRAVTMFPSLGEYYFSLKDWNCGELYAALEKHQIPLFIAMGQFDPNFDGLYELLTNHPNLNLVLTNVTYRIARNIYPLFKLFPRLSIETFGFKPMDGIEEVCERFGAQRLIFGSGMPHASGAAAVAMITYANISQADKERIAHENLDALLGGVAL